MRRGALAAVGGLLLVGPTLLAFESGGYFQGPRVWAGALAWLCVAVAVLAGARLPRGVPAWTALGGLALLAALSLASIAWAPIAGNAYAAAQIAVLYLGALLAGALVLGDARIAGWTEPVLGLGATVVIGYGLAGRLLPGVIHLARSVSALGRLEQPLTYWNAMGEVAALGFVLAARLAGDITRPRLIRALAAAAAAPLGVGLYTSFSRGALFAALAGLVALVALAPRREAFAGLGVVVVAGVVAAAVIAPLHGVTSLDGSLAHRESQGLIALVVIVVIGLIAAGASVALAARGRAGPVRMPPRAGLAATAIIVAGLAVAIVAGARETGGEAKLAGGASRLVSLQSNRYDYWRVAVRAFAHSPLHGIGAGNWVVDWLRWRTISEFAVDAHSLPLQVLAELGVPGALALLALVVGVALAARGALRGDALTGLGAPAGAIAALVVYAAHAPLDWDWQMPAVTLIATALAGFVLARSQVIDRIDADPPDRHRPPDGRGL